MLRRNLLLAGASLAAWQGPAAVAAGAKELRLVVPFAAGGATDMTARIVFPGVAKILGMPFAIDNRPGAGGSVGMAEVARSAPDGNTLGLATVSTHGVNSAVYRNLPYDAQKDFDAITEIGRAPGVLAISADLPATDYSSFIAYIKRNRNKVVYGSPGIGTVGHMWGELFKSTTGTEMVHKPYGPGNVNGSVSQKLHSAYFDQVGPLLEHIRSGRLRAIAVSWSGRLALLPDTPTYTELSLFSNNDPSWFGLVAPVGTPAPRIREIQKAVESVLAQPDVRKQLEALAVFPTGTPPYEFASVIRREVDKMRRINRFARVEMVAQA